MKKIILILITALFSIVLSQAQVQSGEITYKVKSLDESQNKKDTTRVKSSAEKEAKQHLSDIYSKRDRAIPHLRFDLVFNPTEALFQHKESIEIDKGPDLDMGLAFVGGKGVFYTNLPEDLNIHQREYLKLVRIQSKVSDLKWQIKNEFKTIAGYQCQKAKTNIYVNDIQPEKEVTVWFANELPFSFGPMGMVGLPGMILGFERGKYFIYAKDIKLSKHNKKITSPKKGEKVTMDYIKDVDEKIKKNPVKYYNAEE
ncbi:MAG TPA: GLPGLI family protein [Flavobacteriaceae bacterium]|nr:GLPGLI family protein [Flavobacteriaceae bacterium]